MMERPEISICIVNWNTRDDLAACLASIEKCGMNTETIVCDNASVDGSAEMVKTKYPSTILIKSGRNIGFGAGNNLCARESSGEYLLIANPDIMLTREALATLRDTLAVNPEIGAAGPTLINPDGTIQKHYYRKFPNIPQVILYHSILKALFLKLDFLRYRIWEDNTDSEEIVNVDQPPGACMLVQTDLFRKIGGFDERFLLFYEDVDLCTRIKKTGYRIVLNPAAKVAHTGQSSLNKELPSKMKLLFYHSGALYFRLHGSLFGALIYKSVYLVNECAKIVIRAFMLILNPGKRSELSAKIKDSMRFILDVVSGKRVTLE